MRVVMPPLVALAMSALLSGCGSDEQVQTTASSPPPAAVAYAAQRLSASLKRGIQRNVARSGDPGDAAGKCRARKLRYGSTATVSRRYGNQVANQLRILCPAYFVPLGQSGLSEARRDVSSTAYKASKGVCGTFPAAEVAREYGGDASSLRSVARAYAAKSYVPELREQAARGCLAGLRP